MKNRSSFYRVGIGTTYFKNLNTDGGAGFGAYVVGPVPLYHQNQPQISQTDYIVEKTKREFDDKRSKLRASISSAHEKIVLQKEIVDLYDEELLILDNDLLADQKSRKKMSENPASLIKKRFVHHIMKERV